MKRPPYLKQGDTIGVAAPSGCFGKHELLAAFDLFESWGLKIKTGKHLYEKELSFAGSDAHRREDFQKMLDDEEIQAIVCARGGYGTVRIIGDLDFTRFKKHPKWISGYSDITVLHAALHQLGFETMHGIMPRTVLPNEPDVVSFDSLRGMLFGEIHEYSLQPGDKNRYGKGKGILTGGNLSVLYSIAGSVYEPDTDGKILFIEDLNESLYHVDRMMMNLKIRGKLKNLKGLIIGDMMDMKGSPGGFDKPAVDVILDCVKEYRYPVLTGFPAGHKHPNLAFPLGRVVELEVGKSGSVVRFGNR